MSLLEKASGGKKSKVAASQTNISLFKRAMAASRVELNAPTQDIPSSPTQENASDSTEIMPGVSSPSSVSSPFLNLSFDDLKSKIASLPPCPDSLLSAWSVLSTRLPIEAISLFLPRGDFLAPAAQCGFPTGTGDDIPLSIAPPTQGNGMLLGEEARALIAPSLGVSIGMNMRAASMRSDSGLIGLWIYHDSSLEASPDELRSRVCELLADASSSLPCFSIVSPSPDPVSILLAKIKKYRFASAIRYDIESVYSDNASYRGISAKTIVSAFVSASERILEQAGAVIAYGKSSFVCALGSSMQFDPELAQFQFTKTLKRSLPFLSADSFPEGSVMSFDLSSDHVSEELAHFLAI
jgi:hypothetical protein